MSINFRWKHITIWALFILILSGIPAATSITQAQVSFDVSVAAGGNVRSGPGTEFEPVGTITTGMTVRVEGRNTSGEWVRGIASNGVFGWMSNGLLNIDFGIISSLPIIGVDAPLLVNAPEAGAAPAAPPAEGQPPIAGGGDGLTTTATANVNLRAGAGTSFRRIGGLTPGQTFVIDGRNPAGDWARGAIAGGTIGWVFTSFLNVTGEQIAALPVVTNDTPFGATVPAGGTTAAPAPASPPVVSRAPVTGFAYGGHVQDLNSRSIGAMNQAGMTWVKKQFRVGSDATGFIQQAHANGFRVMIGAMGDRNRVNDDGYLQEFANFVAGMAAAGADAIEIWNEPNIDREWITGDINPRRYTELLRVSYNAIKAANPNTMVISGAPAPTGAEAAFPGAVMNDDRYMREMAAAGAANYMDCIGIHYNEGIVPPSWTSGDPRGDYYTRYLRSMMDVYYNAFGGTRPLCFTELGYLTPQGFGPLPGAFGWAENVTVAQQAQWLREAINISRNSGRVRLVIVWNVDFTNYGADPMAGYAMIRPDGSCPACAAISGR